MGLARVPRSRCARWATGWLAAGLGRLSGVKAISRSDGGVGVLRSSGCRDGFRPPLFQRNLIRLGPLDSGHAERFDPSSFPSAIDLGSPLSSSVDQPKNPQQIETF